MRHSASVVLPEPEPPSTAACRFRTLLLSVIGLPPLPISRPAEDAALARTVLVEDHRQRQFVVVGGHRVGCGIVVAPGCQRRTAAGGRRVDRSPVSTSKTAASADAGSSGLARSLATACAAGRLARPARRFADATRQLRPSRSRRRSWMIDDHVRQQLGVLEPLRRNLDRCDDARGTRAPSSCAPTRGSARGSSGRRASRNLRNACAVWFFRFGGKSDARSMKHCFAPIAASTLSSCRFRPPPCVGRLHRKTRASVAKPERMRQTSISSTGRSSARSRAVGRRASHRAGHSILRQRRAALDRTSISSLVVGRHFGFRRALEALPHLAVVDRAAPAQARGSAGDRHGQNAAEHRRQRRRPVVPAGARRQALAGASLVPQPALRHARAGGASTARRTPRRTPARRTALGSGKSGAPAPDCELA